MLLLCVSCSGQSPFRDFGIDTSISKLTDQNGHDFDLKELKGNVVWLYFGFTYCPDFCPMTQGKLTRAWKKLGFRQDKLKTIFITVDPKRDTQQVVKNYLSNFDMPSIGLTGKIENIRQVTKRYGIYFEKVPIGNNGNYTVNHSTSVFMLDTDGKLRYIFPYQAKTDKIASITKLLLPIF